MREDGTHIIEIGSHMLERVNLPTADQGTHRNASGRLLNRGSQLWRFRRGFAQDSLGDSGAVWDHRIDRESRRTLTTPVTNWWIL